MAEKPRKLRVGVVFGGRSGEHEVSLAGAASVMAAMDKSRFELVPIGIAKDGRWLMGGDPLRALAAEAARLALASGDPEAHTKHELLERATAQDTGTSLMRMETSEGLPPGLRDRLDVVLVLLHGPQGEDGTVQGLLQLAGVPYTGSGVLASAVGMDKAAMKLVFAAKGLPICDYEVVLKRDWQRDERAVLQTIVARLGFPVFVKPANLGSSVGISKAKHVAELRTAIKLAAEFDRKVVVEAAVPHAREIEVAVLGNDEPEASVPGEIIPSGEFYDYEAKYISDDSRSVIPAELAEAQTFEVRRLAIEAYKSIDCSGLARVDFLLAGDSGVLYLNELNTLPGFTTISMYSKMWAASGVPYPELIDRLIALALDRHAEKQQLRTSM